MSTSRGHRPDGQGRRHLFGIEFPAISAWAFGPEQAAAILQPVLSVLGTETVQLFVEGRPLLHSWFPQVQDCTIEGVGHLLHIQRPNPSLKRWPSSWPGTR